MSTTTKTFLQFVTIPRWRLNQHPGTDFEECWVCKLLLWIFITYIIYFLKGIVKL
eukprot:m.96424 g.96424  ORF g.96424 m.96424 type:complete len:55 (+) comp26894_c0_seq2:1143-1307(+)